MRGKEFSFVGLEPHTGITPAYAGKRRGSAHRALPLGDHPRVCGEKLELPVRSVFDPGSPPRMRGKGQHLHQEHAIVGITPAYAGKSRAVPAERNPGQDHPRVCGEKYSVGSAQNVLSGSPPRMRGKELEQYNGYQTSGITPAYAGKRGGPSARCRGGGDHPRVCGEKRATFAQFWGYLGSPPRMRGKD